MDSAASAIALPTAAKPPPSGLTVRQAALKALADNHDEATVLFTATIYDISSIDNLHSTFYSEINLHLYWYEERLVEQCQAQTEKIVVLDDHTQCGKPALDFFNLVTSSEVVKSGELIELRKQFAPGIVHFEQRLSGTFKCYYDLHYFPFDVQTLSIIFKIDSKADLARNRIAYPLSGDSSVKLDEDVRLVEWRLYNPVAKARRDKGGRAVFQAQVGVRRKHEYFSLNVALMIFILACLSFGVFLIPPDKFADRMSVVLVLMLTSVAFKFVVGEDLPKTPYFTVIDMYMSYCFIFLSVMTLENMTVAFIGGRMNNGLHYLNLDRISLDVAFQKEEDAGAVLENFQGRHPLIPMDPWGEAVPLIHLADEIDYQCSILMFWFWVVSNLTFVAIINYYLSRLKRILGNEVNKKTASKAIREDLNEASQLVIFDWHWLLPLCFRGGNSETNDGYEKFHHDDTHDA